MNTPASRLAGTPSGLAARPRPRLSRPDVALLGAAGAVALAIVAFGFVGNQEPDPIETAAVLPPRLVVPETPKVIPQLPKPTESAPMRAPVATDKAAHTLEPTKPAAVATLPASGPDERDAAQAMPADSPDTSGTASIVPNGLRGSIDVQVAETEADIAKLEVATGMLASAELPAMKPAKVTKWVNLRDGPADESQVLMVVPANADVEAEANCNWCTVVYKGQRGYIYKNFLRRSTAEEAAAGQGLF